MSRRASRVTLGVSSPECIQSCVRQGADTGRGREVKEGQMVSMRLQIFWKVRAVLVHVATWRATGTSCSLLSLTSSSVQMGKHSQVDVRGCSVFTVHGPRWPRLVQALSARRAWIRHYQGFRRGQELSGWRHFPNIHRDFLCMS